MYNINEYFIMVDHNLIYSYYKNDEDKNAYESGLLTSDELLVYILLSIYYDSLRFRSFIHIEYVNKMLQWDKRVGVERLKLAIQGLINKGVIKGNDWIFNILKSPTPPFVCIMEKYLMKIINMKHSNKSEILHTYLFILKHINANFNDKKATEKNNWCYFKIEDICSVVDISEKTARRYIGILKQLGVIISDSVGIVQTGGKIHQDKCYYALPEHRSFLDRSLELRLKEIDKSKNIKLIKRENIKPFDGLVEKYKTKNEDNKNV